LDWAVDDARLKRHDLTDAEWARLEPLLRQHRAVATRYDKRDFVWRGTVDVASIRIWLRDPVPRLNPRDQPAGQTA
jgi:transposase